ncbi:hypothetical protein IT568_00900 [bacterium]|nr:hypothetical protein [bacterium]
MSKLIKILICLAFASLGNVFAKPKNSISYNVVFDYEMTYNDNVSLYSKNSIDDFKSNQNPYRYGISTYDDLIFSPTLKIYATQKFSKDFETKLRLKGTFNQFFKNGNEKTYQSYQLRFYNSIFKENSLDFGYSLIPKFYVRDVFDTETREAINQSTGKRYTVEEAYRPFEFEKESYDVSFSRKLPYNLEPTITYSFTKYFYNEFFTEYDTKIHQVGGDLRYKINELVVDPFYSYETSNDKGDFDSDASYDSNTFGVNFDYRFPKVPYLKRISTGYELEKIYYQSNFPVETDPVHAGRNDSVWKLKFSAGFELNKQTGISFDYLFRERSSSSKGGENESQELSDVKNYKNNQITLTFSYSYN